VAPAAIAGAAADPFGASLTGTAGSTIAAAAWIAAETARKPAMPGRRFIAVAPRE
jgi:hypothetical protein